jgi:hypothetical protein
MLLRNNSRCIEAAVEHVYVNCYIVPAFPTLLIFILNLVFLWNVFLLVTMCKCDEYV